MSLIRWERGVNVIYLNFFHKGGKFEPNFYFLGELGSGTEI